MKEFSTELKVGTFAILILLILAFMTFKVGGLQWTKKTGYIIDANFNNIAGLDEKTKVKVAGVEAGVVDKIELHNGKAKVRMRIDSNVPIYKNSRVSIKSTGLLGDKFLDINIGSPDMPALRNGDTINNVTELVDVDQLARSIMTVSDNFTKIAESLNEALGTEEAKNSLSQTIANLKDISVNLNKSVIINDQKLRTVLDNVNNLTASINSLIENNRESLSASISNMKDFSGNLKSSGPELIDNLNKATKDLKALIEETRPGVKEAVESLDSITRKIDKGEGSLGKFIQDDRLYESINKAAEGINNTLSAVDRFKTFITFQAEYLTKSKEEKGYFYVTLQPRIDKYYILGVVGDPIGSVTAKETIITPPGTTVREEEINKKIEFTAQFAKRFGNAAVRIGLTENTFGLGGDYFFNNDKGKVTADAWDFSKDERDAKKPHVKVGVDYFLFRNLFVNAGADNILNKTKRGGYVGMGVRFEDEDFKYLFGTISRIPTR